MLSYCWVFILHIESHHLVDHVELFIKIQFMLERIIDDDPIVHAFRKDSLNVVDEVHLRCQREQSLP